MKKKNIIWRAACILMALTLATTSVTLTRAKYVSNDVASGTNFQVYRLLPAIVHTSFHRTTFNANLTTYYNCPAGKWAFFIIGGYGLGNGGSSGNSEANTSSLEGRRKPGILCGIYTKASTGTFTIGNIPYGARNGGSGGNGGCGKYILDTITSRPDNVATNDTTKKASLANIVTVAGGGGGRSGSNNGGYAGGYQGVNGPPTATVQNINSPYGQPETGIIDGWRGEDAAAQTTSRGSGNPGDAMAGGGSGSRWEWWKGGDGGNGGGGSDGSNGGWFQGGLGGSRSGYNCAGGGGGVFGGGGGGPRNSAGGGGGGSSYVNPDRCTAISGNAGTVTFSNYAMVRTNQKYPNPTTYYEYALNYYFDQVANYTDRSVNSSASWSPEMIAILVWLGPA